jgi:hypothetical protein
MGLLTDGEIQAICADKAERVSITHDAISVGIGIKVGLFSQATTITPLMTHDEQIDKVHQTLRELSMMNNRERWQQEKAKQEAGNGSAR